MENNYFNLGIVCRANIIRSPFIEKVLQHSAKKYNLNLIVDSAGLNAKDGGEFSSEMQDFLKKYFGWNCPDLNHSSKKVNSRWVNSQDLILTMNPGQKKEILELYSPLEIFTLPEFVGFPKKEIKDPSKFIKNYDGKFNFFPQGVRKHLIYPYFGYDCQDKNGLNLTPFYKLGVEGVMYSSLVLQKLRETKKI